MIKYKAITFYTGVVLWGLCVMGLTVHLFFPYQQALKIAFQNVAGNSRMAVSVHEVRPGSMGVHIGKAQIGHEAIPGRPAVEMSGIDISWRPWSMLTGVLSIVSAASAYGGTVQCNIFGIPVLTSNNPSMTLKFSNIDLAKYPSGVLPWFKGISGVAEGSVAREVTLLHPAREKGNFKVTIKNGEIKEIYAKNFQGLMLPFKEISAEGRLDGSRTLIDRIFLIGPGISMRGNGAITKGDQQPVINLKLSYESGLTSIPLPSRGTIMITGSQWSPNVTVSADVPDKKAEKK